MAAPVHGSLPRRVRSPRPVSLMLKLSHRCRGKPGFAAVVVSPILLSVQHAGSAKLIGRAHAAIRLKGLV